MAVKESLDLALDLGRGSRIVEDDNDVLVECAHCGPAVSGAVTVAVVGTDILFVRDGVADTTIQVGATPGTIDLTDAAGDDVGEVVDAINTSPFWEARAVDALRSDASAVLLALVATNADQTPVSLLKDTSVALNLAMAVSIETLPVTGSPLPNQKDFSHLGKLFKITANSTYGAGASLVQVFSVVADKFGVVITETKIFEQPGGATTVNAVFDFGSTIGFKPSDRELGYKLVARIINDTAMTDGILSVDLVSVDVPKSAL